MEWIHVLTIVGTNIALMASSLGFILWFRSESRADMREFSAEIRSWKEEIYKEMKDFHGRLCSLEEKKRPDP